MELKRDGTGFAAAGGAESKKVSLVLRGQRELRERGKDRADLRLVGFFQSATAFQ